MKGSPGLRICGGTLRGRVLAVSPASRPTEAKVRQALFSIWMEVLAGARLLDLYAGSGAVAIEAISRGALEAVLVESDRAAQAILRRNLALVPPGSSRLLARPAEAALEELAAAGERFDLVFADPPYRLPLDEEFLERCEAILAADGRLALEHRARAASPSLAGGLVRTAIRRYGESALSFYGRSEAFTRPSDAPARHSRRTG